MTTIDPQLRRLRRAFGSPTVVRVLEAAAASGRANHEYDARAASTAELCDHIVTAHREQLRLELPRLERTAATVVRAHGRDDPRLPLLADELHRLARDLVAHLDREEQSLFPACIAAEAGTETVDARAAGGTGGARPESARAHPREQRPLPSRPQSAGCRKGIDR